MLKEAPAWTFTSKRPMTRWFQHVRLLPDRVVGQWFCLDRSSGARLWERRLQLAEIVGIEDGVIVANERRHLLDIYAPRSGCYGISLETGKIIWSSEASGFWGWALVALGFRDWPVYVLDGRCYCRTGRVLDVRTGRLIERIPQEKIEPPEEPESDTDILGRSRDLRDSVKLTMGDGVWLSHKLATKPEVEPLSEEFLASVWEFRLFLTDNEGRVKWQFDLKDTGYEICYCPYVDKSRCARPYLYLITCKKRTTRTWKKTEIYNPTLFHLLTLDLTSGRVAQDIQITQEPADVCRFEDWDDCGVLVSEGERRLRYFEKL